MPENAFQVMPTDLIDSKCQALKGWPHRRLTDELSNKLIT